MATPERRKARRGGIVDAAHASLEIFHTFGATPKTICKVIEFDEFGVSFLLPAKNGYFMSGTPLKYVLVRPDKSRTSGIGIVRYYHIHNNTTGESFYKIGMKFEHSLRDVADGNYLLRPERFNFSGKSYDRTLRFVFDNKEYSFEIIDVSPYSAAFYCDAEEFVFLRASTSLSSAKLFIGNTTIFEGTLTITHIYHDKTGRRRIVVEPRNDLINIELLERLETVTSISKEAGNIIANHKRFDILDPTFKAAVADLRIFLEEYKDYLESPVVKNSSIPEEDLLEKLFNSFFETVDHKITLIDDIVTSLNLDDEKSAIYKSFYRKNLLALLLQAPVNHRSYYKPAGYPGDYEIMKMAHENRFAGSNAFAKMLHKYSCTMAAAKAVRKRTEYLANRICEFVESSSKEEVEVFSIASGPALEMNLLMQESPKNAKRISLTLLDQEIRALQFSQINLYENRIRYDCPMKIRFIHKILSDFLKECAGAKNLKKFDLIYAFGLFDYFDNDVARFVLKCLMEQLNPCGQILISNFSLDNNRYKILLEFGMEWYLVYRQTKDLEKLAASIKSAKKWCIDEIEGGMVKFLKLYA